MDKQNEQVEDTRENESVIELTGEPRTFSTNIDSGLLAEFDVVRAELRKRTGLSAYNASKRLMIEFALSQMLLDFKNNGKDSQIVKHLLTRQD